jgi:hypothetical protein
MNDCDREEKESNNTLTKDEANKILDRIIGFINNCDNKASTILAMMGILFALFFSTDAMITFKSIVKTVLIFDGFVKYILFINVLVSVLAIGLGLFWIVRTLIATINYKEHKKNEQPPKSVIFYRDIAELGSYIRYCEKARNMSFDDYMTDLQAEIYINSCICIMKFRRYNKGVIFSISGMVWFAITQVVCQIIL